MKFLLRSVLFVDGLFYLMLGLLLLVSPFATLYAALQLPQPQPALYGQLLGVAALGLAWLLMQATFRGELTVAVARTVGLVNLASALLIAVWLIFLNLPVEGAGKIWLPVLAAMLGFFALVQMPAAKRVRLREQQVREAALQREQESRQQSPGPYVEPRPARQYDPDYKEHGVASPARSQPSPEYRREPVITPPPGYERGTEVVTDPTPDEMPSRHHARQNPHS